MPLYSRVRRVASCHSQEHKSGDLSKQSTAHSQVAEMELISQNKESDTEVVKFCLLVRAHSAGMQCKRVVLHGQLATDPGRWVEEAGAEARIVGSGAPASIQPFVPS